VQQEPGGGLRAGRQCQASVELLGLSHVVLQDLRHRLAFQRHDALVGLLPGERIDWIERDDEAALAAAIDQLLQ
jgi:hypothetical protein